MQDVIKSLHFLVVEDAASMRQVITAQLKAMGAERITGATQGQDALNILNKQKVDVVLTDLHMPVMSGLELLRAIRASEQFKHLPVLMITSENERGELQSIAQSGVTEILIKPYNASMLELKLISTLRKGKMK
ncbi:response regulator [Chitinimonas sp. BJYL2]|uniref:response regulator n=1 Tax=Chitinimonas sp. BJYL2 TaxID=2976696 RepID=UPI0022B2E5C7|nr:response regulator [Chitinimonas sp. BJYL2]